MIEINPNAFTQAEFARIQLQRERRKSESVEFVADVLREHNITPEDAEASINMIKKWPYSCRYINELVDQMVEIEDKELPEEDPWRVDVKQQFNSLMSLLIKNS